VKNVSEKIRKFKKKWWACARKNLLRKRVKIFERTMLTEQQLAKKFAEKK
jgi:hypothetical protein